MNNSSVQSGGDSDPSTVTAPTLSYAGSAGTTGMAGVAMSVSPSTLTDGGASINACGIQSGSANAAKFPAGLSVSPTTCVISGTPTADIPATRFTLAVTNSAGASATALVTLTINPAVPAVGYAGAQGTTGIVGAPMSISPTTLSQGQSAITACGVVPGTSTAKLFPAGLDVNPTTCVISGTPTTAMGITHFRIAATNAAGTSAQADIALTITAALPGLSYSGAVGRTGVVGFPLAIYPTLVYAGGAPLTGCAIKPGSPNAGIFPSALKVNPTNCQITGTPTAVLPITGFTVTATNAAGSADAPVSLAVDQSTGALTCAGARSRAEKLPSVSPTPDPTVMASVKGLAPGDVCNALKTVSGPFYVQYFGAKGDGVSDDYDAMQAAASCVSQSWNQGRTLIYPAGTYFIDRHISISNNPSCFPENKLGADIVYQGCNGISIRGLGAKISVNGHFYKGRVPNAYQPNDHPADPTTGASVNCVSGTTADTAGITPFSFDHCSNFTVDGFTVDGNIDQMQRDGDLTESGGSGIVTAGCVNYTISNMIVEKFPEDGVLLGRATNSVFSTDSKGNPIRLSDVDQNGVFYNVRATSNGRDAMSVIQDNGGLFCGMEMACSGFTGVPTDNVASDGSHYFTCSSGQFAGNSPMAGVDVEPDEEPVNGVPQYPSYALGTAGTYFATMKTANLTFDGINDHDNNVYSFISVHIYDTENVLIQNSTLSQTTASPYGVMLSSPGAVLRASTVDLGQSGDLYTAWDKINDKNPAVVSQFYKDLAAVQVTIGGPNPGDGNTIRSGANGIRGIDGTDKAVIQNNILIGLQTAATLVSSATFFPCISDSEAIFEGNSIYYPAAFTSISTYPQVPQVGVIAVGHSLNNHYYTGFVPQPGVSTLRQIVDLTGTPDVESDIFPSNLYVAPCTGGTPSASSSGIPFNGDCSTFAQ